MVVSKRNTDINIKFCASKKSKFIKVRIPNSYKMIKEHIFNQSHNIFIENVLIQRSKHIRLPNNI